MLDNAQIKVFLPVVKAGFIARGQPDVGVKQNYQPDTQGMDVGAVLYFTKLFDHRYGWTQKVDNTYNEGANTYTHTERQLLETTWQFMAEYRQAADDTDGLTASDVANLGAAILQHDDGLAALAKSGLTVLRITQVRNLKVVNGEGQFEDLPSFDLVVLHEDVTVTTTPGALIKSLRVKSI